MQGFDAAAAGFSTVNAQWLGKAANLAYEDEPAVTAMLATWGLRGRFISVRVLPKGDTQAFVAADDKVIVVAFRGTKDVLDFVTDAEFAQEPYAPAGSVAGRAHHGFLAALEVAWSDVRAAIGALRDRGQTIWVTGHSLGGALATLATARLRNEGVDVRGLYTFGSPRVGDPDFADSFDRAMPGRAFGFVNDLDIVAQVPPDGVPKLPPYRHVGTRKYFDAKGALGEPSLLRWAPLLAIAAEVAVAGKTMSRDELKRLLGEPLADHAMKGYITNLDAARDPSAGGAAAGAGAGAVGGGNGGSGGGSRSGASALLDEIGGVLRFWGR